MYEMAWKLGQLVRNPTKQAYLFVEARGRAHKHVFRTFAKAIFFKVDYQILGKIGKTHGRTPWEMLKEKLENESSWFLYINTIIPFVCEVYLLDIQNYLCQVPPQCQPCISYTTTCH